MRFLVLFLTCFSAFGQVRHRSSSPPLFPYIFSSWVSISTPGDITVGLPTNSTLTSSVTLADGSTTGTTVQWNYSASPGHVSFSPTNSPTTVATWPSDGIFRITVTAQNGVFTNSSSFLVFVLPQAGPQITITGPTNGASFFSPVTLTAAATATSPVSISNVVFRLDGNPFATSSVAPYSADFTPTVGTHILSAKVADVSGSNATDMVNVNISQVPIVLPPIVDLTSPANGQVFTAPASIPISADASDPDGTISQVEFFNGVVSLGADLGAPYATNWTGVTEGTYTISATATDNTGNKTASGSVTIRVDSASPPPPPTNSPPVVSITSPTNGVTFVSPISLQVLASATDPDGAIARVTFSDNGVMFSTSAVAPYAATYSPTIGTHSILATASDNLNTQSTASITFNVSPQKIPPTVVVSSPAEGQSFVGPTNLLITASASDADGTISKVDFYRGTNFLGNDSSAPYSFIWTNAQVGNYSISAIATDNDSLSTISPSIFISIIPPPVVSAGSNQTIRLSYYASKFDDNYTLNHTTFDSEINDGWGPLYDPFGAIIGGTISAFEGTQNRIYLERALAWFEKEIALATATDFAGFKNWHGAWSSSSQYCSVGIISPLEDYGASYEASRLPVIILSDPTLFAYSARAQAIYGFLRDNVIEKNLTARSFFAGLVTQTTVTTTALDDKPVKVMLLLGNMVQAGALLGNSDGTTLGWISKLNQLARGFKNHDGGAARFTTLGSGKIWDAGLNNWPGYGTTYTATDTAHANPYADCLMQLSRSGIVFDASYAAGVATLFRQTIWDQSSSSPQFKNFIDGSNVTFSPQGENRPAFGNGAIYQGWVKLSEIDTNVFAVCDNVLRKILAGTVNPSLSYNNSRYGLAAIPGHLCKADTALHPPFATLQGFSSVPGAVSFTWSRFSGPGTCTINSPNSARTTALFSVAGTNQMIYAVGDNLGHTYNSVCTVIVNAPLP
jgi:hypothetical protein